jgi:hypothetical protein
LGGLAARTPASSPAAAVFRIFLIKNGPILPVQAVQDYVVCVVEFLQQPAGATGGHSTRKRIGTSGAHPR